jgi:hypothetical protein
MTFRLNINLHTSYPSVFISSTFLDLRPERDVVSDALEKSGFNVNALDVKPASNDSSKDQIIEGIKESDFVILIVGHCYGSIIPEMTSSDRLSITRWEYVTAANRFRKDVLVFFKKPDGFYVEDDAKKQALLQEFKSILRHRHNSKYFSTPEELACEIEKSLISVYRSGVKLLQEKLRNERDKTTKLSQEVEMLRRKLDLLPDFAQAPQKTLEARSPAMMGLGSILDDHSFRGGGLLSRMTGKK